MVDGGGGREKEDLIGVWWNVVEGRESLRSLSKHLEIGGG